MDRTPRKKFPQAVTDRVDRNDDRLGVISIPGALLKVDLSLTHDDILLIVGLLEHYRREGDQPCPSYQRLGMMVRRDRKILAERALHLSKVGLIPRTKHRKGYRHDLGPLIAALTTAPLKEFPVFDDNQEEKLAAKEAEIARLRAEVEALKNGTPVPVPNLALAAPVQEHPQVQAAALVQEVKEQPEVDPEEQKEMTIVLDDGETYTVTHVEIYAALHKACLDDGKVVFPRYNVADHGIPNRPRARLFEAVRKTALERTGLSKDGIVGVAMWGVFEQHAKAQGLTVGGTVAA